MEMGLSSLYQTMVGRGSPSTLHGSTTPEPRSTVKLVCLSSVSSLFKLGGTNLKEENNMTENHWKIAEAINTSFSDRVQQLSENNFQMITAEIS